MHFIESIFDLKSGDFSKVIFGFITNLVLAIVITIVGFWLTGILTRFVNRLLQKSETDAGLTTFLSSFLSLALKIMVVITAITQLGVQMTSFLTLLGAAGIAVGMAFSGTLSNFAGGIMILVLKPFKVGDEIKALGEQGTISEIQIFNTYLKTVENKIVIFPNGPLANGSIVNYTKEKNRRIEWTFVLSTEIQLMSIQEILLPLLNADKRILNKPEPFVGIQQITENGLELKVRCWVKTADYGGVFYDLQHQMVSAMQQGNIAFAKA